MWDRWVPEYEPESRTVQHVMDERLKARPLKEAYHYMRSPTPYRWSNEDLKKHMDAIAVGLVDGGYKRGSKLAVWAGNDKEVPAVLLGLGASGNHMVAIDPDLPVQSVGEVLNGLECRGLLFSPRWGRSERVPELEGLMPGITHDEKPPRGVDHGFRKLEHLFNLRMEEHPTILSIAHLPVYDPSPSPLPEVRRLIHADWPLFTSVRAAEGGWEAGKTLSTSAALSFGESINSATNASSGGTVLVTAPMHTALGACAVLGAFSCGAKFVLVRPHFDAKATLETITRQRVTSLVATAQQLAEMEELVQADASSTSSSASGPKYSAPSLKAVIADTAFSQDGSAPSSFFGEGVLTADSSKDDEALR